MDLGLLINLVESFPSLYDKKRETFKNAKLKEQYWVEIATAMGISVDDCKRSWKNLRERYAREKRGLPSGAGADESQWEFFRSMQFLDPHIAPRRTYTATKRQTQLSWEDSFGTIVETSLEELEHSQESSQQMETAVSEDSQQELTEPQAGTSKENTGPTLLPTPKKRAVPCSTPTAAPPSTSGKGKQKSSHDIGRLIDTATDISNAIKQKDSLDSFAQYISHTLREKSPRTCKRLKRTIVRILEEDSDSN